MLQLIFQNRVHPYYILTTNVSQKLLLTTINLKHLQKRSEMEAMYSVVVARRKEGLLLMN